MGEDKRSSLLISRLEVDLAPQGDEGDRESFSLTSKLPVKKSSSSLIRLISL